jgi:hypothetical protein
MKHVFWVHSSITFLIAKKIITENTINDNECIFLVSRNYTTAELEKYMTVSDMLLFKEGTRIWKGKNIIKTIRNINYFNNIFCEIINERFYFYTPHTLSDLPNIIISNKLCEKYFIIEEGSGSYCVEILSPFKGWKSYACKLLKLFFPRLYTAKESFITTKHPKFGYCYGFGENVFPTVPKDKIIILPLPFEKIDLPVQPDAVIVIDHLQGLDSSLTNENYADVLTDLALFFVKQRKYNCIAYKFHPTHYFSQQSFIKKMQNTFNDLGYEFDIKFMEIPQRIAIENIAYSYYPDFYGLFSSVLLYASIIGCRVYGINRLFIAKEERYRVCFEKIPDYIMPKEELDI